MEPDEAPAGPRLWCGRTAAWWLILASALTTAALLAAAAWTGVQVVRGR